jgi:hypothetical protein
VRRLRAPIASSCHHCQNLTPTRRSQTRAGLRPEPDSPDEAEHDRLRRYPGAYRTALQALDIFQNAGGIHVSVSSVLGKPMLREDGVEELLGFLASLGVDEAWLSECKPAVQGLWSPDEVITEAERQMLCACRIATTRPAA